MEPTHTELVTAPDGPLRLDAWLAVQLQTTRSQAQRLIREGFVTVDHVTISKPGTMIKTGTHVSWRIPEQKIVTDAAPLDIVFEDAAILVVNKHAGVVVHAGNGVTGSTLVDSVIAHRGLVAWDERAGLVHRLDRDTSGVMVIAKSIAVLRTLQEQWHEKKVRKEYHTLVVGLLQPDRGAIEAPIERHNSERHKMSVKSSGRNAKTEYEVARGYKGYSFLRAFPITGRTHQIRVHLASIGHPVVGDHVYGNAHENEKFASQGLHRQFLHAARLTIVHPVSGTGMTFEAPLPPDLRHILDVLE